MNDKDNNVQPVLLNSKQAYEYLGISKSSFRRLRLEFDLPVVLVLSEPRFHRDDLDRLINERRTHTDKKAS